MGALPFRTMLLGLVLCGSVARADELPVSPPVPPPMQAAIRHVITEQLAAFQREDGAAALAFASPGIARTFGDGAHFLAMVRTAYPAVFHPRSFSFGPLSVDDGQVEQKVEFIGPDGASALGIYEMEREGDGSWRIAGCALQKSERIDL